MKRMVLGIVLILATFGLVTSPAVAATDPQVAPALSATDQAFLASLAMSGAPSPELVARNPIRGKSVCSATATCGSSPPISCSSNVSGAHCSGTDQNCSLAVRGSVTCNGVTTQCPNACTTCPTFAQQCADTCGSCQPIVQCDPPKCTCKRINGPCT